MRQAFDSRRLPALSHGGIRHTQLAVVVAAPAPHLARLSREGTAVASAKSHLPRRRQILNDRRFFVDKGIARVACLAHLREAKAPDSAVVRHGAGVGVACGVAHHATLDGHGDGRSHSLPWSGAGVAAVRAVDTAPAPEGAFRVEATGDPVAGSDGCRMAKMNEHLAGIVVLVVDAADPNLPIAAVAPAPGLVPIAGGAGVGCTGSNLAQLVVGELPAHSRPSYAEHGHDKDKVFHIFLPSHLDPPPNVPHFYQNSYLGLSHAHHGVGQHCVKEALLYEFI